VEVEVEVGAEVEVEVCEGVTGYGWQDTVGRVGRRAAWLRAESALPLHGRTLHSQREESLGE
jgi:hypothetical protein